MDVYPDVDWSLSFWQQLEAERAFHKLTEENAFLLRQSGSAMKQLGLQIVRTGNMEARAGIEMARRIVAESK